jgi:hypothetical protein
MHVLYLDATFCNFVQGDLSLRHYYHKMKSMAFYSNNTPARLLLLCLVPLATAVTVKDRVAIMVAITRTVEETVAAAFAKLPARATRARATSLALPRLSALFLQSLDWDDQHIPFYKPWTRAINMYPGLDPREGVGGGGGVRAATCARRYAAQQE